MGHFLVITRYFDTFLDVWFWIEHFIIRQVCRTVREFKSNLEINLPSIGGGQWHTCGGIGSNGHGGVGGGATRRGSSVRGDGGRSARSARRSRSREIGGHSGRCSWSGRALGLACLELNVDGIRAIAEGGRAADAARLRRLPSRHLGGLAARGQAILGLDLDVNDAVAARVSRYACARGAPRAAADACRLHIVVASLNLQLINSIIRNTKTWNLWIKNILKREKKTENRPFDGLYLKK